MALFSHEQINFDHLRKWAYNKRWAEVPADVIPLTAADSDFPSAPEIREGLMEYISAGYFPYVPNLGYDAVRESIARHLNEKKDEHVDPDLVLPIDSAARGMYIAAEVLLGPGDEAIVFDPVDFLFAKSVEAAGAKVVLYPAMLKDGHIDLGGLPDYITPNTRMICLCNPHNPLGALYSEEDLRFLLELAEERNLHIMNDEIWSDIVFRPHQFRSILSVEPALNHRVVSVYGFSKSYGIAGLRAGCIYTASPELFRRIVDASDVMTTAGGISSLSQIAMQICLDRCGYWNEAFVEQMQSNRDYALARIADMPLIHCTKPDATFLLFPDITETGMESGALTDYLQEQHKIALVPGTPRFFGPGAEGRVRICLATSREVLTEGMDRLERGLRALQPR